jgi:very-short-patch-repair endonuclease
MTTAKARALRKSQTATEARLWQHLRGRRLSSYKFRRQEAIGPYIVDFVSYERKLIIELDGSQHGPNEEYDKTRTRRLVAGGFKVLRFWDNDVFKNIDGVLETIATG